MISLRNAGTFLFLLLANGCAAETTETTASSADEVNAARQTEVVNQTWVGVEGQRECTSPGCSFRVRVVLRDRGRAIKERCKTFVGSGGLGNLGVIETPAYDAIDITVEESDFPSSPTDLGPCVGSFDTIAVRTTSVSFDPTRDAERGNDGIYRTTAVLEHMNSRRVVFMPGHVAIASRVTGGR